MLSSSSLLSSNWNFKEINGGNLHKMKLKFDKNKEIFHGVKLSINGLTKPFIGILGIKKDLISQVVCNGEPSGTRTPDNRIKSTLKLFLCSQYC